MLKRVLCGLALLSACGSASAADLPSKKTPPSLPAVTGENLYSWTGFYVGGSAGYGFGRAGSHLNPVALASGWDRSWSLGGASAFVHAGSNYQFANNIVVGAEVEFTHRLGGLGPNGDLSGQGTFLAGANLASVKFEYQLAERLRLGYAFGGFLPYISVGFLQTGTKVSATSLDTANNVLYAGKASATHLGYVLGTGVEYALTRNWSVRLQYDYQHVGSKTYNFAQTGGSFTGLAVVARGKANENQLRAGVSYRF